MTNKKIFDVFLSHSSVDKPWVTKLKLALERHGIDVWLDKDEIRPGDSFIEALELGLAACKSIVLIISPEAMESGWVKEEYYSALNLVSQNHDLRLIPVILRDANIPRFLSNRMYVDFREDSLFEDKVRLLVWGIKGRKDNNSFLYKSIEIPFVICAMTHSDAVALENGTAFDSPSVRSEDKDHAATFLESLKMHYPNDRWMDLYGDTPDEWHPFLDQKRSIIEILFELIVDFNVRYSENPENSLIRFKNITSDYFSTKDEFRLKSLRELKSFGGVLIIDAVSIFHPMVREFISSSPISDDSKIAIVVLSPFNPYSHPINSIIENKINARLKSAYLRFLNPLDQICDYGVGDIRSFERWLYTALPLASEIATDPKPHTANREQIRRLVGEPLGIDKLIFGEG